MYTCIYPHRVLHSFVLDLIIYTMHFIILLLAPVATATITFNSPLFVRAPTPDIDLDIRCHVTYSAPIDCTSDIAHLRISSLTPSLSNEKLTELCTPECIRSLNKWDIGVQAEWGYHLFDGDAREYVCKLSKSILKSIRALGSIDTVEVRCLYSPPKP